MLAIDGAQGEGGGQILRTALALSLVTRTPFRLENIRAGREKPGLRRQHLAAVAAAAEVGGAEVAGAAPGSRELTFRPGAVRPGRYRFAVGSAGSATLVLQTILPPLLTAAGESEIVLEGGTHNPFAPPFEFLARAFLPLVARLGPKVEAALDRPGFYPAGGGRFRVAVRPAARLAPLELLERGRVVRRSARALLSNLPEHVGRRELETVRRLLGLKPAETELAPVADPAGPGNALVVEIEAEQVTEVFTAFGQPGVPAERVARQAGAEAREYLEAGVPVGRHLADQLLLPLALAGGGRFRTLSPTPHATTNAAIIGLFLPARPVFQPEGGGWLAAV